MDKASFFILNIFLNSFLAFLTVAFLIEGLIFLLRIQQGRVASTFRMIPIIKLPFDLFLYDFSKWSYLQGINPLNCEEGTRTFSVTLGASSQITDWFYLPVNSSLEFTVPGAFTFTIGDLLGHSMHSLVLKIFAMWLISFTLILVIRKLFLYYRSLIALKSLTKNSKPLYKKIRNLSLLSYIKKHRVKVVTSPTLACSPFVVGVISPIIYIPDYLSKKLSKREYEAVLAHELEHVRYKDGTQRLVLDFIGTIFWWIPTKWLLNRIEEGQEMGSDANCKKYGIDSFNLSSAIFKSAKYALHTPTHIFVHSLAKHVVLKRLKLLLEPPVIRFKKTRFIFSCLAFAIAILIIFLGRFWMF